MAKIKPPKTTRPNLQGLFEEAVHRFHQGKMNEAASLCQKILAINPRHVDGLHLFAVIALQAGHFTVAVELLTRLTGIADKSAPYHALLGIALQESGRLDEAMRSYGRALDLTPGDAQVHYNLGTVLRDLNRLDEAIDCWEKAVSLEPGHAEIHNDLGNALKSRNHPSKAITSYRNSVALRVDDAETLNNLAVALQDIGRLAEARTLYRRALRLQPDLAGAHSNLLRSLHYEEGIGGEAILAEARQFATRHERRALTPHFPNAKTPARRLRIGYVSGDFRRHPVGYFLARVLTNHDRMAVEVFCYSNNNRVDDMTRRLRDAADHWRNLAGVPDAEAAKTIGADGIDILVDLSGHTGFNRLPMFARKPAPVQLSWLGFWGTTGLSTMDYLLTDGLTVPQDQDRWYSERVIRLPNLRFCYAPPEYAPAPADLPPLTRQGHVTFGSFNNLTKLGPDVVRLWATVLKTVPRSRMVLKWATLADAGVRRTLKAAFEAEGIAADRLDLRGATPHEEMLGEYDDIDVALDPFPFSGGLTSCEALWMGVPVVTLPGPLAPSRQTMGFLRILGLSTWVAPTPADYIRIATDLAADEQRLRELRHDLRPLMAASALCDGKSFTRAVESVYRDIWGQWCENNN